MPPKKDKFPPQKSNIRQFFKPVPPKPETKEPTTNVSDNTPAAITKGDNDRPAPRPSANVESFSSEPQMTSSQRIIRDSDEESDLSDSDLSDPSAAHVSSSPGPSSSNRPTHELPTTTSTARSRIAPHLKRTPEPETKGGGSSISGAFPTTTKRKSERSPRKPNPAGAQSIYTKNEMTAGEQTSGGSYDEGGSSGSDSDLPDLFTPPISRSTRRLRDASSTKSRAAPYASPLTFQPKHKYKFSITSLVSQSRRHEATEASAQRAKFILDEPGDREETEEQDDKGALLESVISDKDADTADKILLAVARTEATSSEKRWYFFDPNSGTPKHKPTKRPASIPKIFHEYNLGHMIDRDSTALSGAMRNVTQASEELSEKDFLWILEMSCIQPTTDLEEPYFDVLLAVPEAIHKYLCPKTVKGVFDLLGAFPQAIDWKTKVEAVGVYKKAYEGRQWGTLQSYIKFLGEAAKFATPVTCGYTMSLLARLCADRLVRDVKTLLSTVQETMTLLCKSIKEEGNWEISCRKISSNIYKTVAQEPLCLQILNCIRGDTPRLRDLQRRFSLAVFCQDHDLTQRPAEENFDLRRLVKELSGPRFQIDRNTDYVQLAALISILGTAIGDGSAAGLDLSDPQVEEEYNSNIDELAYQLKIIWGSINDRGTLSPSRIHTKRTVEKLRNRLLETTRTRLKPKQSIFDLPGQGGDREGALKQSAFMTKHFRKPITNE